MEGELTRRLEPGGKVGKAEADRLMPDNGFPHRVAVLGIGDRDLKGRLRHADRLRSNADAADLEVGECDARSEEHTSELQSLMRISYAVFCLKKKKKKTKL